jgi:protein-tyrosine-phosphatase
MRRIISTKKKVLFLCIGNICRSPMAEVMARKYGSDELEVSSAGFSPQPSNHPFTRSVLKEKNLDLGDHIARNYRDIDLNRYDLIVNMSGVPLPKSVTVPVEEWNVEDPYTGTEDDFRTAREKIEMLVMNLVLRVRLGKL